MIKWITDRVRKRAHSSPAKWMVRARESHWLRHAQRWTSLGTLIQWCPGGNSLILRRSRSLAVTHSLPSPSDGLHSRSCSWRHNALVLSAPIATLLRIGQKWHLRARYSKLYFLKFLISENILHSIWLAERTRATWRHEHDLEWSPSDGEGRECVTVSDLDRLRIRLGW